MMALARNSTTGNVVDLGERSRSRADDACV
jgi:hypothetical protein